MRVIGRSERLALDHNLQLERGRLTAGVTLLPSAFLFLLTALIALWAAPDRLAGLGRFLLIGAGGLLVGSLVWGVQRYSERVLVFFYLGCGLIAALLSFLFFSPLGLASGPTASGLILLLPFLVAGLVYGWLHRRAYLMIGAATLLLISAISLLVTSERSAWLSLAIGAVCGALLWWRLGPGSHSRWREIIDTSIVAGIIVLLGVLVVLAMAPDAKFYGVTEIGDALISRLDLWHNTWDLIQDYRFTGSGLGSSAMVYSTYVYLLHVPVFYHAHNLYLQIALEQGLPGLIGWLGMMVFGLYGLLTLYWKLRSELRPLWLATIIASVTLLVYGLFDAELYATSELPLIFLPLGSGLMLHHLAHPKKDKAKSQAQQIPVVLSGVVPLFLLGVLLFWPGARADWYANLGAVTQTQIELSVYHWPTWPLQDVVRRSSSRELARPIQHYQRALALDAANVTAHQRLGQIALSLGDYPAAQQHLDAAYAHAPQRDAVRHLLGEVYAVTGNPQSAAALWSTIETGFGQLEVEYWWYEDYLGEHQQAAWVKQAMEQIR